jgi:hypothetical protein
MAKWQNGKMAKWQNGKMAKLEFFCENLRFLSAKICERKQYQHSCILFPL